MSNKFVDFIENKIGFIFKSSYLNVWTRPIPFKLTLAKFGTMKVRFESLDRVIVHYPRVYDYNGGPLNGFYLIVEKLFNSNRPIRSPSM